MKYLLDTLLHGCKTALTLLALPLGFSFGPGAAAATIDPNAWYVLISEHSGLALDIAGASPNNAAPLIQSYRTDAPHQQFRFLDSGAGYYRLQARHSGLVLDVYAKSTDNGADVVQWPDNNGGNQQWQVADADNGAVSLINRNSGKALDVWEWSNAAGDRISQYDITGGANQQWQLIAVNDTAPGNGQPEDPNIHYVGRWDANAEGYLPHWAGGYIQTAFTGTTVALVQRNRVALYASIDGGPFTFYNAAGTINLTPTPLDDGAHTLKVAYRSGDTIFQGLAFSNGGGTLASPAPHHHLEFVGDSITLGALTGDLAVDSYGFLIGEQLGFAHSTIARSGYCLVSTSNCTGQRTQFFKLGSEGDTNWDFSRYQAAAVVINLGTNDYGRGVGSAEFQSSYTAFLAQIRGVYPNAVLVALDTLKSRYTAATRAAVDARRASGDADVHFVDTDGWLEVGADYADGDGHPNEQGHQKIADRLRPIIVELLK